MKLIAIMRVKDEIGLIRESLARLSQLADEIVILDNGSTDGTQDVYREFPKVVQVLQTEGFNEGRDKIMLLEAAKARQPDWLIFLDADEIFEKHLSRSDLDRYMKMKRERIDFRFCHFWLDREHYRVGRKFFLYSLQPLRCLWRNSERAYFQDQVIHNDIIKGITKWSYFSPYRIKHYGYADKEKIKAKLKLYRSIDGDRRDYDYLDPDQRVWRLPFIEFENRRLNYAFIIFYKYVCHALWIGPIIWYRLIKLFKKNK